MVEFANNDEIEEISQRRRNICLSLDNLMEDINKAKKRHNKSTIDNQILKEIQSTKYYKHYFNDFLSYKHKKDKLNQLNKIKSLFEKEEARYIFYDANNIIYFIEKIYPDIINYDLIEDFKDIGIIIEIHLINYFLPKGDDDILVTITFNHNVNLSSNSILLKKYFNPYIKKVSIEYKSRQSTQESIARRTELDFSRELEKANA